MTDPQQRPTPPDPLDDLLGRAEWPEPESSARDRLHSQWHKLRSADVPRPAWGRRIVQAVMVVSAVLLIALGAWLAFRPDAPQLIAPVEDDRPAERLVDQPPAPDPSDVVIADAPPARTPTARPANAYEQMLVQSIERRRAVPPRVAPPTLADRLQQYLDGDLELEQLKLDAGTSSQVLERLAVARIEDSSVDRRLKLIALLREIGGPASVPAFVELSNVAETRDAAFDALLERADPETLLHLAYRHQDVALRSRLCQELLARNDDRAVAAFLQLLMDPSQRQIALEGLDAEMMPPVELLFRFMQEPDYARRLAAAIALGRIDQPEVTERLIAIARSRVNRQEALVALLVDRDQRAREFLTLAQRDQGLYAAVNSANVQLQLLSRQFPGEGS